MGTKEGLRGFYQLPGLGVDVVEGIRDWWMKLRNIMDVLAQHDSVYEEDEIDPNKFKEK